MRRLLIPGALLALLVLAVVVAQTISYATQPSATDLLRKAYSAERKATLSGTMTTTVSVNGRPVTARVKTFRDGARTRMEYLTGPSAGLVILDNGKSVVRMQASRKSACICSTPEAPERLDHLLANYTPVLVGTKKVAGRECLVVNLRPKHKGSPSEKLWIDKVSSAMLRTERYGSDGKLTSLTRYEQVDFAARPAASLFEIPRGWKVSRSHGEQCDIGADAFTRSAGFKPLRPKYVARGYSFDSYHIQQSPCALPLGVLKYTNGLNTISVFEHKCTCKGAMSCSARGHGRGSAACILAGNPQATMFQARAGDIVVVVVGDATDSELRKMADSIK